MSPRNSWQSSSTSSRSSNRVSNPNIFSDEFALEPLDIPETSPFDADDDPTPTSASPPAQPTPSTSRQISPHLSTSTSLHRPPKSYNPIGLRDVVSPTPNRSASRASNALSDIHRASSTSSHFSMPRAQSPYVGATGPSHPYGMYPQVTRTSSIASVSTVRPIERPFVAPNGPEHPYAMYSQNTVPEEDDTSSTPAIIPLGFPGMGQQYQRRAQTRDDIADIVGSDGHIEELPPYTRYADELAPKESPPSIRAATVPADIPREAPLLHQSSHIQYGGDDVELNTTISSITDSDSSGSFKEKVKKRSRQKICCGLPFWFLVIIIAVLLFGVIVGAAIGGVVGSKNGAEANASADTSQNTSTPTATVTSIAFIDGTPLPTDHPVPEVPNGPYNFPTNNLVANSQGCIQDGDLSNAWACMPPSGIGVNIVGQGRRSRLTLDAYPLNGSFLYGAQPPNLERQNLTLVPSVDVDSNDLGPSLFAWTEYDKFTILHEDEIQLDGRYKRGERRKYGVPEDKPWFCWFNQTVIEFFIYVHKPVEPSTATTTGDDSYPSTLIPSTITSISTITSLSTSAYSVTSPAMLPMESIFRSGSGPKFWSTASNHNKKREWDDDDEGGRGYPDYPLLVKIEEKRKPSGNIQPYCEQMQVLDDWTIGYLGIKIPVPEDGAVEFSARQRFRRSEHDPNISENCVCEWMTDDGQ